MPKPINMTKSALISALLAGAAILASAQPAEAFWGVPAPQNSWSPDQARDAVKRKQNLPLSEIYDRLRKKYGGRALDAWLINGVTYGIIWETGRGERLNLTVDARTGQER